MGFFDLFKKKSEEEEFYKAVNSKDYLTVAALGEKLLQKHPDSTSILTSYIEALVKLGKKKEAVAKLLAFAERKIKDEYYDIAIPILKRVLKIEPTNVQALKLLVLCYNKKELYYEAFKALEEAYKRFKEAEASTTRLKELFEKFLQEQFHPLFYERYADILISEGEKKEAFTNYVLAGNMYASIKNYKAALRSLLKAREIEKTENIDRQIVEILSYLPEERARPILIKLINEYSNIPNFLRYIVSNFKAQGKLTFLKALVRTIASPKTRYFLLALIGFEEGEIEDGYENLEKLKLLDRQLYNVLYGSIAHKLPEIGSFETQKPKEEELPEPEEILEVLDEAIDLEDLVSDFAHIEEEKASKDINQEIQQFEKDGIRYISMAEAMIGIGNYNEAIDYATKALKFKNHFIKALSLISNAYKQQGKYREALTLLMENLEKPGLKDEERAKIKELIADIYETMGEKDRALLWYREAFKDNPDPDIDEKIKSLSS